MFENGKYILMTNNFCDPWIWIKRAFAAGFLISVTVYCERSHMEVVYWKYIVLPFCILFILLSRTDDLMVDSKYLYYIRRSILPMLSRVRKFDLSTLDQIRSGGIYTPNFEFVHLLGYRHSNSLEMIFKDDTSVTLDVQIYRSELDSIVSVVKYLVNQEKSNLG